MPKMTFVDTLNHTTVLTSIEGDNKLRIKGSYSTFEFSLEEAWQIADFIRENVEKSTKTVYTQKDHGW